MGIIIVNLSKINLDGVNFDEYDPETTIHVRLVALCNIFKQRKMFKKDLSKELMPVEWYPTKWWDWQMSEDGKKEIKPFLIY